MEFTGKDQDQLVEVLRMQPDGCVYLRGKLAGCDPGVAKVVKQQTGRKP